jgi:hypothetical protein
MYTDHFLILLHCQFSMYAYLTHNNPNCPFYKDFPQQWFTNMDLETKPLMGKFPTRWKHTKMEYTILSQLVGLSIMGHGTKYKWIIC